MKLIKTPSLFALILVPIVGMMTGCQSTPSVDPNSPDNIDLTREYDDDMGHAVVEISYLCQGVTTHKEQIISVFYDSRYMPSEAMKHPLPKDMQLKATLRMNDDDHDMKMVDNHTYMVSQPNKNGDWLVWQMAQNNSNQGQLMSSPSDSLNNLTPLYQCQVTR